MVFALVLAVGVGPVRPAASAVLAAAAVVYIGVAATGSRRSTWLWFLATGVPIAADGLTDGAVDATSVLLAAALACSSSDSRGEHWAGAPTRR